MEFKYYKIGNIYAAVNSGHGFIAFERKTDSSEIVCGVDQSVCNHARANGEEIEQGLWFLAIEHPLALLNGALAFFKTGSPGVAEDPRARTKMTWLEEEKIRKYHG
jgi:hypothetical protein